MSALVKIQRLSGVAPGTASDVSQVRFKLADDDALNVSAPLYAPQKVFGALRDAVASSNALQTVPVDSSVYVAPGDYLIVSPGTASQEVVLVDSTPTTSSVRGIFRKAHSDSAKFKKVLGSFSKTFRVNVVNGVVNSLSAFRLGRHPDTPLPTGVYDQYGISGTYSQISSSTPGVYPAFVGLVPSDRGDVFHRGPVTAPMVLPDLFVIQWLLTSDASLSQAVNYLVYWDEA